MLPAGQCADKGRGRQPVRAATREPGQRVPGLPAGCAGRSDAVLDDRHLADPPGKAGATWGSGPGRVGTEPAPGTPNPARVSLRAG